MRRQNLLEAARNGQQPGHSGGRAGASAHHSLQGCPGVEPWPTTRTTTSSWPATRRAARTATAARSTGGTACGPRTTRTSWRACASRTTPGRTSSRTATRTTTATIMRRGGRGRRRRLPAKRPPQRRDDDDVMVQVQRELATQLHRQEQLHASMEKLLDRQRKLAQELVERDEQSRRHVQRIEAVVSSMATGEAVPDAPAPGPASAGAGDGRDHAGTLPRLAEELPYKDGLLSWTEENVGELFACIAFKHLKSVKDEVDNEEAEENAREIKQAAMHHGVDGRALLHLTIEDMEKIGETAGHVEGGGECALKFVGHRIAILSSIHAFVEAHKAEPWDRVKELPLLLRAGKNRHEGEAKLTTELCKTFGVDQIKGDNTDKALNAAMVHKSSKPKGKSREEVVVPVFATLVMKKLTEDTDGNLSMIGTFIQRPLLYDLKAFDRESGNESKPYFDMRVNEGESKDCFELRKVASDLNEGPQVDVRTDEKGYFARRPPRPSWPRCPSSSTASTTSRRSILCPRRS